MEKKGNWASVVPMVLYFIRSSPCSATGMSPFMARQGWEPATPVQILYKSWAQTDLGEVDLEDWVMENAERVELAREKVIVNKATIAEKCKQVWDGKAKNREFSVGDEVLIRKPGMNLKLSDSWEGPFVITKQNSPLSYAIDTGDRKIPSVHVQLIKQYYKDTDNLKVTRVTSVFELDTQQDDILDRYSEVVIDGEQLCDKRARDIKQIEDRYSDILTKEPGLTNRITFSIDTGDSRLIFQRAYNTPVTLKQSIDKEIDWLLQQNFIRPSTSPWPSPMVTVKKSDGTARLCVDFKRINSVTQQVPFYMPRVEEVLEWVGKAKFISKLDLTKGYYEIPMTETDICKTAFICHRGKFEFLRMPFGVKNAPAIFQELMQALFDDDKDFCTPYMDDIVVFGNSWEEHLDHIERVLTRLREAGLTANPDKCKWGGQTMEFLGHQVGDGRMMMPAHRAEALGRYSQPTTKKGLHAFLGAIGFYRRYM